MANGWQTNALARAAACEARRKNILVSGRRICTTGPAVTWTRKASCTRANFGEAISRMANGTAWGSLSELSSAKAMAAWRTVCWGRRAFTLDTGAWVNDMAMALQFMLSASTRANG